MFVSPADPPLGTCHKSNVRFWLSVFVAISWDTTVIVLAGRVYNVVVPEFVICACPSFLKLLTPPDFSIPYSVIVIHVAALEVACIVSPAVDSIIIMP
jgi:hypothetical protein